MHLASDKRHYVICRLLSEKLVFSQVARCTKIINPNTDDAKYVINVKQIAKASSIDSCSEYTFVVVLSASLASYARHIFCSFCSLLLGWVTKLHRRISRRACVWGKHSLSACLESGPVLISSPFKAVRSEREACATGLTAQSTKSKYHCRPR